MADIVIRGGRVCDGNGGASFIGDGALLSCVWEQLLGYVWELPAVWEQLLPFVWEALLSFVSVLYERELSSPWRELSSLAAVAI